MIPSHGTISPPHIFTMSPTTISLCAHRTSFPSRTTPKYSSLRALRRSNAPDAECSKTAEINVETNTAARIPPISIQFMSRRFRRMFTAHAASRILIIGSPKFERKRRMREVRPFFSSVFFPYFSALLRTSSAPSPRSMDYVITSLRMRSFLLPDMPEDTKLSFM